MLTFGITLYLSCRACDALRSCLPEMLRDATFASCLRVSSFSLFDAFCPSCVFMEKFRNVDIGGFVISVLSG